MKFVIMLHLFVGWYQCRVGTGPVLMHSLLLSLHRSQHHVCSVCERPFQGHLFFERSGHAYCEKHFDMVRGLTRCWLLPPLPTDLLSRKSAPAFFFFRIDTTNNKSWWPSKDEMDKTDFTVVWPDLWTWIWLTGGSTNQRLLGFGFVCSILCVLSVRNHSWAIVTTNAKVWPTVKPTITR